MRDWRLTNLVIFNISETKTVSSSSCRIGLLNFRLRNKGDHPVNLVFLGESIIYNVCFLPDLLKGGGVVEDGQTSSDLAENLLV